MIGGMSGDMLLGAMVDAGLSLVALSDELGKLEIDGWTLEESKVSRGGLDATLVDVILDEEGSRTRTWSEFYEAIESSSLDDPDKRKIRGIFDVLAVAEADAHDEPTGETHLHELGTVDTLVDIAGAVVGLRLLGVESVYASAFPVGSGISSSSHGVMGATSKAAAAIYKKFDAPIRAGGKQPVGEAVTPTGAAIVASLAKFRPTEMQADEIGHGAGQRNPEDFANVVGLCVGEERKRWGRIRGMRPELMLLETNIDDSPGEVLGYVHEQLLDMGCLDVWFTPIQMKKNRPATMLSALVHRDKVDDAAELILRETTTLGVRRRPVQRYEAERQVVNVDTSLGKVPVKLKRIGDTIAQAQPEYEACKKIAIESGMPLSEVMRIVSNEAILRGSPWGE